MMEQRQTAWFKDAPMNQWQLKERVGKYVVSTVELPFDHSFNSDIPALFETMVFRHEGSEKLNFNPRDLDCRRYPTKDLAIAGHHKMVAEWMDP